MIIFVYDKTFEGLLTAVFDAYSRRTFPDLLVTRRSGFIRTTGKQNGYGKGLRRRSPSLLFPG